MRKQTDSFTVDEATRDVLAAIAQREASGNRSEALRRVVREAGEARGLWPVLSQAERQVSYGKTA